MIAVWHRLVTTSGAMDMTGFMACATMVRRTSIRICRGYLDHMFVDMVAFDMLQMTVLKVVNMTTVSYCGMAAIRAVHMCHDLPRCVASLS
jgi:hypothetical protein